MKTIIEALATANPPLYVTQEGALEFYETRAPISAGERALYRRLLRGSPIRGRYIGMDTTDDALETNPDRLNERFQRFATATAADAACKALAQAGREPHEIGGIVVNTCTGYLCPGLSSYLVQELGLAPNVKVLDLMGMGCGAAIPNLEAAAGMIARGMKAPVLSVAVEICTATHFMGPQADLIISNVIFGDGAAAVVLSGDYSKDPESAADDSNAAAGNGKHSHENGTLRALRDVGTGTDIAVLAAEKLAVAARSAARPRVATLVDFESVVLPDYREDLRYRTEQGRLRNVLSKRVPELGAVGVEQVVNQLLARRGLTKNDIAWWAVHAGGTAVLDAVHAKLELRDEQLQYSHAVFEQYGNLSSPTVLFVLEKILAQTEPKPGGLALLVSFGAGFTAFAALLEI